MTQGFVQIPTSCLRTAQDPGVSCRSRYLMSSKHRWLIAAACTLSTIAVSSTVAADTPTTASPETPDDNEPPVTTTPNEDPAPTDPTTTVPGPIKPPIGATRIETVPGTSLPDVPDFPGEVSSDRAVITEIMLNPVAVYDSRGEWFEIHHPSAEPLDLAGWTFGDETHDLHTIDALEIAPGGYVVLARHGDAARNGIG